MVRCLISSSALYFVSLSELLYYIIYLVCTTVIIINFLKFELHVYYSSVLRYLFSSFEGMIQYLVSFDSAFQIIILSPPFPPPNTIYVFFQLKDLESGNAYNTLKIPTHNMTVIIPCIRLCAVFLYRR